MTSNTRLVKDGDERIQNEYKYYEKRQDEWKQDYGI